MRCTLKSMNQSNNHTINKLRTPIMKISIRTPTATVIIIIVVIVVIATTIIRTSIATMTMAMTKILTMISTMADPDSVLSQNRDKNWFLQSRLITEMYTVDTLLDDSSGWNYLQNSSVIWDLPSYLGVKVLCIILFSIHVIHPWL